ncbi:hypothetical protein [Dechloromonas hortensis]|uniref:hypothetical protein n=1 Tax=Dechloromonas hortensis TaxID=337779 RepID=UPI0012912FF9|nr:hypothetical protein [Dechloromonas hortensis]
MGTQLELLKNRLYGEGGLGVKNIKLFLGSDREIDAEDLAREINKSLTHLFLGETSDIAE